ncbi:hypothetical protein BZG36_03007 [Bifiguratus adelaidae]|uniref:Borealin N-terminal domain-containing protein n=1 Tax=Bifiguratus adelaidae TaxID=1938954 RepID=A0A261XZJ3_9FUNG|nr:hypothetical protein BZG36_03007 [Bifiguratus adelaidae]
MPPKLKSARVGRPPTKNKTLKKTLVRKNSPIIKSGPRRNRQAPASHLHNLITTSSPREGTKDTITQDHETSFAQISPIHKPQNDDPQTPETPRQSQGPWISDDERALLLENLELEVQDRTRKCRDYIDLLCTSLNVRGELEINRLTPSIRKLTMRDFCLKYNASPQEYSKKMLAGKQERLQALHPVKRV